MTPRKNGVFFGASKISLYSFFFFQVDCTIIEYIKIFISQSDYLLFVFVLMMIWEFL